MKEFFLTLVFSFLFSVPSFGQPRSPILTQGNIYRDCRDIGKLEDYEKNPSVPFQHVCYSQKITPSSDATFYQALKEIFPDLQPNGKATTLKARRAGWKSDSPMDTDEKKGEFDLSFGATYLLVREAAKTQLIILSQERDKWSVLGLFQAAPGFKMNDLIELDAEPEQVSMLITPPKSAFLVKEGSVFFPVSYWHDNSSESYDSYALFTTINAKLQRVYEGPYFYGYRDEKSCRNLEGLEELKPLPTQHEGFSDVSLKIKTSKSCEVKQRGGVSADKEIQKRIYPAILYWDPQKQKYMGGSKEFVKNSNKR